MFLKEPTLNQLHRIQHKYVNNLSYSLTNPNKIVTNNTSKSFKWSESKNINFQAALYTYEEKIVVQIFDKNDSYQIIYLPGIDTNNFQIIFTKNYFVLNYESKFLLIFSDSTICEINMQFAVQFYDDDIIAYDSDYNKYYFYLKNNIFIPKKFIVKNPDEIFYEIYFDSKIRIENEFVKLITTGDHKIELFTLYDDTNIITFFSDEFNNRRYVLDKIDIFITNDNIRIGEYTFELEQHNYFFDDLICCFAINS